MTTTKPTGTRPTSQAPPFLLGLLGGLATLALGVIVLAWPTATLVVLAVAFGLQLVILGVSRLVASLRQHEGPQWYRTAAVLFAGLTVVAGLICVFHPFSSLRVLIVVTALGWLLDGVGVLVSGRGAPSGPGRTAMVVMGIVSILAALLLVARPGLGLLSLVLLGGWVLVALGAVQIAGATVRHRRTTTAHEASTPVAREA